MTLLQAFQMLLMFESQCQKAWASQLVLVVKSPPANAGDIETRAGSLGQEDPLEEGTATHSSILAWRIPWTEEPGGLQSKGVTESDTTELLRMHTCQKCGGGCLLPVDILSVPKVSIIIYIKGLS